MTQYNVLLSDEAWEDLDKLMIVIAEEYKSPITAQRYIAEIWNEIIRLRNYAGAIAPYLHSELQLRYGHSLRRINHKKIAILYTIKNDDTALIVRIMPGSIIFWVMMQKIVGGK